MYPVIVMITQLSDNTIAKMRKEQAAPKGAPDKTFTGAVSVLSILTDNCIFLYNQCIDIFRFIVKGKEVRK